MIMHRKCRRFEDILAEVTYAVRFYVIEVMLGIFIYPRSIWSEWAVAKGTGWYACYWVDQCASWRSGLHMEWSAVGWMSYIQQWFYQTLILTYLTSSVPLKDKSLSLCLENGRHECSPRSWITVLYFSAIGALEISFTILLTWNGAELHNVQFAWWRFPPPLRWVCQFGDNPYQTWTPASCHSFAHRWARMPRVAGFSERLPTPDAKWYHWTGAFQFVHKSWRW